MFYNNLKDEALKIHKGIVEEYNASYENMNTACKELHGMRIEVIEQIKFIEKVINSIRNTPFEFEKKMGEIGRELLKFKKTQEYAQEAYESSVDATKNIVGGAAAGLGAASMAPTAFMYVATTFGTASTGTAISALSGAAAQKAATAWIGRTFAGFAVKQGAGMAAGNAVLALAGPIGWGITASSVGVSLISLSQKNKELADSAVMEAKKIAKERENLDEITAKVDALCLKTRRMFDDIKNQKHKILKYMDADYKSLSENEKDFLGSLVNNSFSLAKLLNEIVV